MLPHAHGTPVNAGWGWNWTGRERATGRVRKYFTRGSYGNKQELIDHLEAHFPGIEFLDGGEATSEPTVVLPMPPHAFQHGILDIVKRELQGDRRQRSPLRTISRQPIPRNPLKALPF